MCSAEINSAWGPVAKPVVDKIASVVPGAPTDPVTAVRINALVHLGAGGLLITALD